jgi:hypothetical protein
MSLKSQRPLLSARKPVILVNKVVHKKRIIGKKERDKGSLTLQQSNMLNEKKMLECRSNLSFLKSYHPKCTLVGFDCGKI